MTEKQTNPNEEIKVEGIRRCLRKSDLENILGVKRTTRQRITRLPGFPKSFKLGARFQYQNDKAEALSPRQI